MIGSQFRRFSCVMGLAIAALISVLLYGHSGLQAELTALRDDHIPRWQTAQRLQGDARGVGAKAVQLTLAFTLGELQSMRAELDEQVAALEAGLQRVLGQIDDAELARSLTAAIRDFHRTADELAETVHLRATSTGAQLGSAADRERRRERDLARLASDHAFRLASHSGTVAGDIDLVLAAHRRDLIRRLWLQAALIAVVGGLMGALIWRQFRLLDRGLIRRIRALEADMAKADLDHKLLSNHPEADEIDAMRNELALLLGRLTAQNAELERLATTDSLTGLANRRRLFDALEQEVYRAQRYGIALSLIMFDIDHFKRINDNWGHATGDWVLRQIAQETRELLRKTDQAGRYGGEEFVVVLPETDLSEALLLAQRLGQRISETAITPEHDAPMSVTVSMGVAALVVDETGEELIHRADQALYRAKQQGRNRVETALDPADLPGEKAE